MNEIERAVTEIVGSNYGECQCHRETMMLAAEAIREKLDRENGCQYCTTGESLNGYDDVAALQSTQTAKHAI